jgi:hypothetical protein
MPGRTRHAPLRYQLFMEADDKSTNYIEEISNIDSNKWIEFMNYEIDFIYTNHVWILVDPSTEVKLTCIKWVFKRD